MAKKNFPSGPPVPRLQGGNRDGEGVAAKVHFSGHFVGGQISLG